MTPRGRFYSDKCALLDPNAYEYVFGMNWTRTVPEGECWYALNLWAVTLQGKGWHFHRKLNVDDAMRLPAGTVISTTTYNGQPFQGFAYICKPSKVQAPVDPEAIYYDRLDKLRGLQLHTLKSSVDAGSPSGTYTGASMSTDFESGIFTHVSTFDLCWTIFAGNQAAGMPSGYCDHLNTLDEVSDSHTIRFTGNILCPFKRSQWNGIWTQAGSKAGDYSQSSEYGVGIVSYQKLPSGW